jgi:hypothetical protein
MRALIAAIAFLAGCNEPSTGGGGDGGTVADAFTIDSSCPAGAVVYVNATGGSFFPGDDDSVANMSNAIDQRADIGPSSATREEWEAIMACLTEKVAPFAIELTGEDPSPRPHLEIVVTGDRASVAGLPNTVAAVSPRTCMFNPSAMAFVFQSNGDLARDCALIAAQLGHLFQLDTVYVSTNDLMSVFEPPPPIESRAFLDEDLPLEAPDPCTDLNSQNSYYRILSIVGLSCR